VLPGKSPEQDRHFAAFFGSKCALYRPVKMRRLIESGNLPEAHPFRLQSLLDFRVILNLDKIRGH
jgi:hypothetical protein